MGCVATRTCTHTNVLTTLRRKWGGVAQVMTRGRPGGQGGRAGGHGGKELLLPCIHPVLCLGAQPQVHQVPMGSKRPTGAGELGKPHSEGPAALTSTKAEHSILQQLQQDSGMGPVWGPQEPPCCVAADKGRPGASRHKRGCQNAQQLPPHTDIRNRKPFY